MKKLLLLTLMSVIFFSTYAQLKLDANGNVAVGTINTIARLNIQPQLSEPSATNLLIGNVNTSGQGCISIGVNNGYSWIQTWNNTPLHINRQGNNVIFCSQFVWGDVGIGQDIIPSAKLDVNGTIHASGSITPSDTTLKKNINKIKIDADFRNKINQIEPITYKWKNDQFKGIEQSMEKLSKIDREFYNRLQYGFSAQDIQKIFPELVYEDNSGDLGINYQGFIPMLFMLVKDQQDKIEQLNSEIQSLRSDCCSSMLKRASILTNENENITTENALFQNTPNPFTVTTTISFSISKEVNRAMLNVYNMNGTQLKSIDLSQRGTGSIVINGGEFNAGMYLYALIVDGQVIDTKRMVLTD